MRKIRRGEHLFRSLLSRPSPQTRRHRHLENLRIKRFAKRGSFDYLRPLKGSCLSPNTEPAVPFPGLFFSELSNTSFTFRRANRGSKARWRVRERETRKKVCCAKFSSSKKKPVSGNEASPVVSLSVASRNSPWRSLTPSCHWYSERSRQYCVTRTRPASGIEPTQVHDDTKSKSLVSHTATTT